MTKLEVDNYLGLVAASSVIRPGVAKSGMMRQFIQRYRLEEKRKEAHPVLYKIMPDTYGVMVYQEDVIKVAHYFAGLDLGEADVLRRGMSGKYRSREEFQQVKDKFFNNCKTKGYTYELTADVWRQIESFAGYAFAKGHSASYAVESYQSLFLKSYFPLEFMVAVLNNGGGFYSTEFYVHEARMKGAEIMAPHLNKSEYLASIEGDTIYLGFNLVKDLDDNTIKTILSERQNGDFTSVENLVKRIPISLEHLICRARSVAVCPPMLKRPPPIETGPACALTAAWISAVVVGRITWSTTIGLMLVTSLTMICGVSVRSQPTSIWRRHQVPAVAAARLIFDADISGPGFGAEGGGGFWG
jgi:DNA polymerase-3 subunit alpha